VALHHHATLIFPLQQYYPDTLKSKQIPIYGNHRFRSNFGMPWE